MRILVVASTFPAHADDTVPGFVRDQVLAMRAADPELEFTVLAPHDQRSDTRDEVEHPAYREVRFHYARPRSLEQLAGHGIMPALQANPLLHLLVPALFVGEFLALLRLTRRTRPDVLYAHWFTPQAVVARWVGALTRTPFVFTTHASDVSVWWKIPVVGRYVVRSNVRRARAFTAVSRRSMAKLAAFFDAPEWEALAARSAVIPMGVDPVSVTATEADPRRILFLGRLVEKKGVQVLLEAVAQLVRRHPDVTVTVAGDGPLRAELESQARRLELPPGSVAFTGYVTGGRKQGLLDAHGVYVVPSIITDSGDAEGLPVSLMEGMAAGKVCVATVESGADDIIVDGESGFLVAQKDVDGLCAALEHAVGLTAGERRRMTEATRATAERFYWPSVAERHIDHLFKGDRR